MEFGASNNDVTPVTAGSWLFLVGEAEPWICAGDQTTGCILWKQDVEAERIPQDKYEYREAVAPSFGVELSPYDTRDAVEIERAFTAMGRGNIGGLIVTASPTAGIHRDLIVGQVAQHRLPAVYWGRLFVTAGGLISYGPDLVEQYRRAPGYIDRILRGENPADLPVQAPTKNELVLNMKTAKALGLTIPETLLATADEVIQ
jgi:putative ABC transport system substrate-binding protein